MQLVAFRAAGGALNQPPTLTAVANQTSAEAAVITLPLVGGDPDGTPVTYSATGLPGGLSLNRADRRDLGHADVYQRRRSHRHRDGVGPVPDDEPDLHVDRDQRESGARSCRRSPIGPARKTSRSR